MTDFGVKLKHEHGWFGRIFWRRLAMRQLRFWRWRTAVADALNNNADAAADYLLAEGYHPPGWSLRLKPSIEKETR